MSLTSLPQYTKANIIFDKAVNVEGGYTNNPNDRGGPTNYGVTLRTAQKYQSYLVSTYQWNGDMRNFTQPMASYVYDQEFWQKMNLDRVIMLAPLLADILFEAGINFGISRVVIWLQTALDVLNNEQRYYQDIVIDGGLGAGTLSAIQALITARPQDGMKNLLWMISTQASSFYISLAQHNATQEVFESGWQNRARRQYNIYVGILGTS